MWGRLTQKEQHAREVLLGLILTTGQDPGLKALASCLEVSEAAASMLLARLQRKGFVARDETSSEITAAYPLSIRPTQHRVTLRGGRRRRYAPCAIDALGIGPAFDATITAHSNCPHCGRPIRIRVERNHVRAVEPPGTVVWYSRPELLTNQHRTVNLLKIH